MTHDKVRGCHMAPQECDTWHKKEWLTLSHMGGVKSGKNSIFLKKGKTIISVENRKLSKSRMTKRTAPLNSSREM